MLKKIKSFLQKYTSPTKGSFGALGYRIPVHTDTSPSCGNVGYQYKEVQCSEEAIASVHYEYYHSEGLIDPYISNYQYKEAQCSEEETASDHYVYSPSDYQYKEVHQKNCGISAPDLNQEDNEEEQEEEAEEKEEKEWIVTDLSSSHESLVSVNITFAGSLENIYRESSPIVDQELESFSRLCEAEKINHHDEYVSRSTENYDQENMCQSKYTTLDIFPEVISELCFLPSDKVTIISQIESSGLSLQESCDEVTQEINSPMKNSVFDTPDIRNSNREDKQQKDLNLRDCVYETKFVLGHNGKPSKVYHFDEHHLPPSLTETNDMLMVKFPRQIMNDVDNILETTGKESPKVDAYSCLSSNDDSASNHKKDSFEDKEENPIFQTRFDFSSQWTVNDNGIAEYVPPDSLQGASFLYNQKGEMCTFSNQRFIKALIQGSKKLVNVKRRVVSGVRVGCQVVWNEQNSILLSDVADGSKVEFDAIFVSEENAFQALIVWEQKKPKFVLEPSNKSYIWIDSRTIVCEELATQNGKNYIHGYYDKKKIFAEILNDAIFIDGYPSDFRRLKMYYDLSNNIVARVSRLLGGRKGDSFKYVCSCISYGSLPSDNSFFRRDETYRSCPNNTIVVDKNPVRLYCDVSCQLREAKDGIMIEFEHENKLISALPSKGLYSGNSKLNPSHLGEAHMIADILKISASAWVILLIQGPKNRTCSSIISPSDMVRAESEGIALREPVFVWLQEVSSKDKNIIYTLPVSKDDSEPNCVLSSRHSKWEIDPLKSEAKDGVPKCSQKGLSINDAYPEFIKDATGVLIDVSRDYGILEIHNKLIKGTGMALAVFHRSVAYVNQWSFYKDVPLIDQLLNLASKTWHCSLKRCERVVCQMNVNYEVTLAWQGRKPIEWKVPFIMEWPDDDDVFCYDSFQTEDGSLETLVFYNKKYSEFFQGESLPSGITQDFSGHQGGSIQAVSSEATKCSSEDEYEEFSFDDVDLFPTINAGDEKEIVDVFDITSLSTSLNHYKFEYDFGLSDIFPTASCTST